MKKQLSSEEYKEQLGDIVSKFISFFNQKYDFDRIIYTDWIAKDILGHVVMWHESFARNIDDIINGRKLNPLKGTLTDLNENGVRTNREYTIRELQKKMKIANEVIMNHILDDRIHLIPYKKGSRDYTKDEHMEVVYRHIKGHLADLEKNYRS